jgi:hypothetical protein
MTDYTKVIMSQISEHHVPGGYRKLKESYPNVIEEMERDLENNFTNEGLRIYRDGIIKGLKSVGHWDE